MAHETAARAAELAVSRYGADAARVGAVVQAVEEAQTRGEALDVYDLFEREQLLTPSQIRDLRYALDQTRFDLHAVPKNGALDAAAGAGADSLNELRMLGDYHILRRLGEGGMGAVFLGYHEKENRQVAIKVLSNQLAKQQPTLDRFYREAK